MRIVRWLLVLGWTFCTSPLLFAAAQIDLRELKPGQTQELNLAWQFYWQEMLVPGAAPSKAGELVTLPHLWTQTNHLNANGRPFGFATYTTRLLLPAGSQRWGLTVADAYSSYRLFANGKLIAANGKPDTSKASYQPLWFTSTVPLPAADTLDLVMHVANFDHSKGGLYRAPTFGLYADLAQVQKHNNALDLVMSGAMLMGGLFFLGLFWFQRQDKAMLFFALFCMVYSYRPMGSRWYAVQQAIPGLDWHLALRLEYFTLYTAIGLFTAYTLFLYPRDVYKWLVYFFIGFNGLLAMVVMAFPPYYYTQTLVPFLIAGLIMIVYSAFVYAKAWYLGRVGSAFAFWSTIVIMAVLAGVNLEYFDVVLPTGPALFVGYALFLFLQSLVLAFRFADVLHRARKEAMLGLQAKTDFLSTMSHEIRTPLNAVIGMTHLLLRSAPRAAQKEQLEVMLSSSHNLLTIVNDILDYNKIEAGKIEIERVPVSLSKLCHTILAGLRPLADDKGLALKLEASAAIPAFLLADPTRLTQVLTNLIHNALKFTSVGEVVLSINLVGQQPNRVTLCFEVVDTGIGIAPDKLQRIFERFTQADSSTSRQYGGTGLGLAIARKLVELQGGNLEVKSELGKGTTFGFCLEFEVTSLQMAREENPDEGIFGSPGKFGVLLVDDNNMNRRVARAFLERWGLRVEEAENGLDAIERLEQLASKIDLILMDLHMPVMDGYVATKKLRAKGVRLPILALTASLPKEVEHQAYSAGVDGVVVKPFHPNDLYQQLHRHLLINEK
jgi:signal transduction histidine kinase/CheY-like chemotaxis protein